MKSKKPLKPQVTYTQSEEGQGEKVRTLTQNRALHLWFRLVSDQLNESGLDMRKTLKPEIDIPWTDKTVKEYLWRPIQKAMLLKESTTKLTTKEIDKVFDVLNKYLGEKLGIHEPFPSIQELMLSKDFEYEISKMIEYLNKNKD